MPLIQKCIDKLTNLKTLPSIFIETGFKKGDTTNKILSTKLFNKIYSIELHKEYLDKQRHKYINTNVQLICGDSGIELDKLLNTLNEPCVFFLDAHGHNFNEYINDSLTTCSPLIKELNAISNFKYGKESIIIIDDYYYIFNSNPRPYITDDAWYDNLSNNIILEYINKIYNSKFISHKINYDNVSYGESGNNFIMMFYNNFT